MPNTCSSYYRSPNKDDSLIYPDGWFEAVRLIASRSGRPVGIDGKMIVAYMFAAPRDYFKYFKKGKTIKEIADDIFYDNV